MWSLIAVGQRSAKDAYIHSKAFRNARAALHTQSQYTDKDSGMPMYAHLAAGEWNTHLGPLFTNPYYLQIERYVSHRRQLPNVLVFPPHHQVYEAFNLTPFERLSLVIIGQDPYATPGLAHGLAFSVNKGRPIPPSLRRIYNVLEKQIDGFVAPKHGCLVEWAQRGVFLLNATLTVEAGVPNSHASCGWQLFTDDVLRILNDKKDGLIFFLWGNFAKKKGVLIDSSKHHIFVGPHPSPLSGPLFDSCTHFRDANALLQQLGKEPIDWSLK